ncbi:hypothetical protein JXO52_02565 [bacterium]|nr:hypothetical protein [bacterium]
MSSDLNPPAPASKPDRKAGNKVYTLLGVAGISLAMIAKWVYRPWIQAGGIDDLHMADWLPDFFILPGTVFLLLSRYRKRPYTVVAGCALFTVADELVQLGTGATFDPADITAILAGAACCLLVLRLRKEKLKGIA